MPCVQLEPMTHGVNYLLQRIVDGQYTFEPYKLREIDPVEFRQCITLPHITYFYTPTFSDR